MKRVLSLFIAIWLTIGIAFAGNQTTSSTLASAMVDQARKYLNDPTTYGGTQYGIWSDAEMLQWVNDGTMDIVARSHCLEDVEFETLVESQTNYALSDPFIVVKYVVYNNAKALREGSLAGYEESLGHAVSQDVDAEGQPVYWTTWENNVIVYPAPNATVVTPGTEKVTDGDFTESTDWTWGAGWAHDATADEADATASSADLEQGVSAVAGETYLLTYKVKNFAGGSVLPIVGGTSGTSRTANDTYSEYIVAADTTNLKFDATAFTGSIDDVSVKQAANIAVYVVDKPTVVASGAAVLVPAQYDKALVYYIVAQAWAKDNRMDLAGSFLTLYQQELDRFRGDFNAKEVSGSE